MNNEELEERLIILEDRLNDLEHRALTAPDDPKIWLGLKGFFKWIFICTFVYLIVVESDLTPRIDEVSGDIIGYEYHSKPSSWVNFDMVLLLAGLFFGSSAIDKSAVIASFIEKKVKDE